MAGAADPKHIWWWSPRSVTPCLDRLRTGATPPTRRSGRPPRNAPCWSGPRCGIQIRQLGAEVVDAEPHELPPQLADMYIRLKAAGRL